MKGQLVAFAFKYVKLIFLVFSQPNPFFPSRLSSLISKERIYLKMEALSEESDGKEKDTQTQTKELQ